MKEIRHDFMTDEQINTAQLAMVVNLFLNGNPQYDVITQNRIYRKRPAKPYTNEHGGLTRGQKGQGLCPWTPPKAEPLESILRLRMGRWPTRRGFAAASAHRPIRSLKGSKGSALSGGPGGKAPWPCLLWVGPDVPRY